MARYVMLKYLSRQTLQYFENPESQIILLEAV